jgi:hypothetical protein
MSSARRLELISARIPRLVLPCVVALFASAGHADIYKWVDERGVTVITNVRPTKIDYARNFEVVQKDEPASQRAARKPTPGELQDRVERLERELRAERAARQAQTPPPASYAPAYAPPAVTYSTPAYPDYYYDPYYYSGLPAYSYGVYLASRPVVAHRAFVAARGGFAHGSFTRGGSVAHGGFAHGGGGHSGRR